MSRPLPRYFDAGSERAKWERLLARILLGVGEEAPPDPKLYGGDRGR